MAGNVTAVRGTGKIKGATGGEVRVNQADTQTNDLGTIDIEGRIYKPSVFYVLARANLSYQGISIHQDFTSRIVKDALKRPF
jgi:hypothetical protein